MDHNLWSITYPILYQVALVWLRAEINKTKMPIGNHELVMPFVGRLLWKMRFVTNPADCERANQPVHHSHQEMFMVDFVSKSEYFMVQNVRTNSISKSTCIISSIRLWRNSLNQFPQLFMALSPRILNHSNLNRPPFFDETAPELRKIQIPNLHLI